MGLVSGPQSGLSPGLKSGLNPGQVVGFDFSSPSGYETDHWDMQTQTVAGKYDNGSGTATLDNSGGLPNEAVSGVLNMNGDPYNSWEADSLTDSLAASDTSAGNVVGQDFSFRVVVINAEWSNRTSYLGKYNGSQGWTLYRHNNGSIYFLMQSTGFAQLLADATGLNDNGIHVISGFYDLNASMMYLKSSAFAEVSQSSGTVGTDLSSATAITIGSGFDNASIGTGTLFAGQTIGANAQAYYAETVSLP